MKNGIVINGKAYKAVRYRSTGLGTPIPCVKCDIAVWCGRIQVQYPCELFSKKNHLVYFKKTEL